MTEDTMGPVMTAASPMEQLEHLLQRADALTRTDWHDHAGAGVEDLLRTVEQIQRRLEYVEIQLISRADAESTWAAEGFRSINTWLQALTGGSRTGASRGVRLSRALRDHLPETAAALLEGRISHEHAQVLQRVATRTDRLRQQLLNPQMGEAFLVGIAEKLDVDEFGKAVKHWATMADPEAADRNWRQESDAEEVFLSAVGDSYHLFGRLNLDSGRALETALNAQMGRKGAGDERPPAKRRADALVSWALSWLDSGALKPGARIRPHLSIHVPYETLQALCEATGSAVPPNQSFTPGASAFQTLRAPGGPKERPTPANPGTDAAGDLFDAQGWVDSWRAGDDHVISAAVDHTRLGGE